MNLRIEHSNGEVTRYPNVRHVVLTETERVMVGYWEYELGTKMGTGYCEDGKPKRVTLEFGVD